LRQMAHGPHFHHRLLDQGTLTRMGTLLQWLSAAMGTLPQWLSAVVAFAALCVAWDASKAWQKTLTAKRGDELIVACFDFEASIGRFRDGLKRNSPRPLVTKAISELYQALLELKKCYVVAQREYETLDRRSIDGIEGSIETLRDASDLGKNLSDIQLADTLDAPAKDAQSKAGALRAKVLATVNEQQRRRPRLRFRWLNTFGLALGMVGVLMIFIWGPPQPDLDPQGKILLAGGPDQAIEQLRNQYEIMSRIGLGLIGLGFVAQLIGTWPAARS
jgi:hypothetical protein